MVDFGQNIGIDGSSGLTTRYGTIHSEKSGAHIAPTNLILVDRNHENLA
ncbi:polymorphic toxin type 50 domain-containing protein [Pseudomonas congelans]